MSLKVIELNDNALRVGDESGILFESPGFALAGDKQLQLGDIAKQQARLQPTNSYNKYLHELSLDPISHAIGIRHAADIAYAHLLHLAQEGGVDADMIFAVPGNFTRQQLGILLGLARSSPFNTIGMVDSALAAAHWAGHEESIIYAEMQLHQVVLTKIVARESQLTRESVIQVPSVGSQNFMDLMMQLVTGLFIQQCRFNPQHDAQSEQQLYNALPNWLRQNGADQNSLLLELKASTAVHTAKMPRESLINNLSRHYKSIGQQIAELAVADQSKILLSPEFAELPGLHSFLGQSFDLQILPVDAISKAILQQRDSIVKAEDQIQLITSLPKAEARSAVHKHSEQRSKPGVNEQATHVLIGSAAIPLGSIELPGKLGRIEKHRDRFYVDSGQQEFLLNQQTRTGRHELSLGDSIQAPQGSETIRLIQVSNG